MVVLSSEDSLNGSGTERPGRAAEAESQVPRWLTPFLICLCVLFLWPLARRFSSLGHPREVIVYCAQDEVYATKILQDFQKSSDIRVRAVYDNEAVKTVGLANRLLAERKHPQCDVFWGNEEMRTRQLAAAGVFRQTNAWASFGYRTRRLVVNTNLVLESKAPPSWKSLTNELWRGKVALAYPMSGTTATHFHALRQFWGPAAWETWCRALADNKPLLLDGNSMVVKAVGNGRAAIGMTDSDDIAAGQADGLPVKGLPVTQETLYLPNTVAVIRNASHPAEAQQLFEFLQRPEIAGLLASYRALEGTSISLAQTPGLYVDWDKLVADIGPVTSKLNEIFLR
jgi:iron(III) transport system substrate-binding protein